MKRLQLAFILLLTITSTLQYDNIDEDSNKIVQEWKQFKKIHKKKYKSLDEELLRFHLFTKNTKLIDWLNKYYVDNNINYNCGMNQFGDMTLKEFQEMFVPPPDSLPNTLRARAKKSRIRKLSSASVPDSFDWRTQGGVTQPKNQKKCASCWSFSATGAMETRVFKRTGKLISLSEQQLMDCSTEFGNKGCNKGAMTLAFDYVKQEGGIVSDKDYPYTANMTKCRVNDNDNNMHKIATVSGYRRINKRDEEEMKYIVATDGPVCVNIEATRENFMFYKSGVFTDDKCRDEKFNHGMLVVGYGTENVNNTDSDYWIVKNTFGDKWGEKGYIRIARNAKSMCGIASSAIYPIINDEDILVDV